MHQRLLLIFLISRESLMRIKTNSSHIENSQRNSPSKKIERTNFTVHQNILRKMVQNDKFLRRKCCLRIYSDRSASLSKWAISEIEGTCCHNRRPNQKKPFLVYLWSHKKLIERWTSICWASPIDLVLRGSSQRLSR